MRWKAKTLSAWPRPVRILNFYETNSLADNKTKNIELITQNLSIRLG